MEASVRLNQEMRLVADMLRDGSESRIVPTVPLIVPVTFQEPAGVQHATGYSTTLTTAAANTMTLSRGPTSVKILNNRLAMINNGSDPATQPSLVSTAANNRIQCKAAGDPHPNCTGSEVLTVQGFVTSVTFDSTRSVARRTLEATVTLVDPALVSLRGTLPDDAMETFRIVAPLNYTPTP
ncbi:MAG: hypothetical protein G8345_19910 [Magnetococcales bacterium]|nr:hypothetical protein [Magnetococcales bacterium]